MNGPRLIYEGDDVAAARAIAAANTPADVRHREGGTVETWTWRGALRDHEPHQPPQRWEPPRDRAAALIVCAGTLLAGLAGLALHEPMALVIALVVVVAVLVVEWNR